MRKKSVKFDIAMNSQEAVEEWRTRSFHLVLMDLQLPVKDGIEATKEIREAKRFALPPPAGTGTANFTTSAPAFGPGPVGEKPIMSIMGTLAQGKAKKVADHLHLSSNKARRTQLRKTARQAKLFALAEEVYGRKVGGDG
ncbi:hypothetical protein PtA15_10A436 [Puccinia triticina]|uniref:Response regulatory domain-containing protein n=1 Tax=Puccinia triticina TaxID=208348 RepID=A0ABY7CVR7_9BASI|nr:uncharacterized protein PtA15_10A436 [Puccinia triticina]WAQ89013.1 hypothetical protein PtA15_10A436 [Puccinia triticina]